jgi:predicted MFS family arabinose efflux permease
MTSASAARAGEAAGVNETIVEAGGALGVAVMGSVLVASGSFARPMVVATMVFLLGVWASVAVQRRRARVAGRAALYDAAPGEVVP